MKTAHSIRVSRWIWGGGALLALALAAWTWTWTWSAPREAPAPGGRAAAAQRTDDPQLEPRITAPPAPAAPSAEPSTTTTRAQPSAAEAVAASEPDAAATGALTHTSEPVDGAAPSRPNARGPALERLRSHVFIERPQTRLTDPRVSGQRARLNAASQLCSTLEQRRRTTTLSDEDEARWRRYCRAP